MAKLTNFDQMWEAYPNPRESAEKAKITIGGNANGAWITNTCVLRLSRCFNYSSHKIPRDFDGFLTVRGGDDLRYGLRVREFQKYMTAIYGRPTFSHHYPDAGGLIPSEFKGKQGVICFVVEGWSDATGHFDLWNGSECIHSAYFHKASKVYLWETTAGELTAPAESTEYAITASVGRGGVNRLDDVKTVQTLLEKHGVSPGPIDGDCGPETIDAIAFFQTKFLRHPDGRVDLNGRTWRELSRF